MDTTKLYKLLDSLDPPLVGSKRSHLISMFYDTYLEGIKEGKKQVKNQLVENLLLLMDTDK